MLLSGNKFLTVNFEHSLLASRCSYNTLLLLNRLHVTQALHKGQRPVSLDDAIRISLYVHHVI